MKNLIAAFILLAAVGIMGTATLTALDRSIYPGCRVVKQIGKQLVVKLDKELCTGTDMACETAEKLVAKIAKDGYDVCLLVTPDEWVPSVAPRCYSDM